MLTAHFLLLKSFPGAGQVIPHSVSTKYPALSPDGEFPSIGLWPILGGVRFLASTRILNEGFLWKPLHRDPRTPLDTPILHFSKYLNLNLNIGTSNYPYITRFGIRIFSHLCYLLPALLSDAYHGGFCLLIVISSSQLYPGLLSCNVVFS